jgi:hypothetical protein
LQSIAWNLVTPAFQGPDEVSHYAYVQYLAETGHLPRAQSASTGATSLERATSTEEREALTWLNLGALIANYPARPAWSAADLARWHKVERALPSGSRTNGAGPNPAAKNPPLIPVWLVWMLAASIVLAVPISVVAALYRALREDEVAEAP